VAQPHSEPDHPITILVAEDEDFLRVLITRVLWEDGYRTLEARDGGEALHLARLAFPHLHLVITDIMMPNLDGRELGHRLASDCPRLPVLYISAYMTGDVFHRDAPGGAAFLQKPFSPDDLRATVRSLLRAAQERLSPT
jgi:CheY-like chemotaxis protein